MAQVATQTTHPFPPPPMTTTTTTTTTRTSPAEERPPNSYIPRGGVQATLTFYSAPPDGSTPYNYVETPPRDTPQRNYGSASHAVTVGDARGRESEFSTDTHGFALVLSSSSSSSLSSSSSSSLFAAAGEEEEQRIRREYYPEVEALLKEKLGARRVVVFDHTIRRAGPDAKRGPVNRVHIDQTEKAARERVRLHLGDEAEGLLRGRVRIVNVWRPINGEVVTNPLAVASSDSVPDRAMVPVEHRYPDRVGETAGIEYTEGQQWWYWSGMGNHERILLQCYDSQSGKRTAHTAFEDPRTSGQGWKGRESIEVRTLVFG